MAEPDRLKQRLVMCFGLALIAMFVISCGSGEGDASAEKYLTDLERIMMEADEEFQPLAEEFSRAEFESEAAEIEATRTFYGEDAEIVKGVFDRAADLNPPPELEADHEEFVSAGHGLAETIAGISDEMAGVESVAAMNELIESSIGESVSRNDAACLKLQTYANTHGVDVDLNCT
jgi:hypothetical protein